MWWIYALLSALFASLAAIFAKIGITGGNSNLATAIRTIIILMVAWGIVLARDEAKGIATLSKQKSYRVWPQGCRGYIILKHCRWVKYPRWHR